MKDDQIIQGLRARDPAALEALMDGYIPYVSAVVWNILRHAMTKQDAEEVVSDVFLAAWNQAEKLEGRALKAWLGAVARNMAKNKLRHRGFELPLEEDVLELPDADILEQRLEEQERQDLVRWAVDSLQEPDREIFLRHYYFAQTVREIARCMRLKEATVKTRLRRGRMRLKQVLMRWDVR